MVVSVKERRRRERGEEDERGKRRGQHIGKEEYGQALAFLASSGNWS